MAPMRFKWVCKTYGSATIAAHPCECQIPFDQPYNLAATSQSFQKTVPTSQATLRLIINQHVLPRHSPESSQGTTIILQPSPICLHPPLSSRCITRSSEHLSKTQTSLEPKIRATLPFRNRLAIFQRSLWNNRVTMGICLYGREIDSWLRNSREV